MRRAPHSESPTYDLTAQPLIVRTSFNKFTIECYLYLVRSYLFASLMIKVVFSFTWFRLVEKTNQRRPVCMRL